MATSTSRNSAEVDLAALLCVDEFEELARERLSRMAMEYAVAGVADEATLRENRAAFERLRLVPRVFVDVSRMDTSVTLFGRRHDFPILLAPCSYQKLTHPDGELAVVAGANLAGATFITATFASVSLEDTAAASRQPLWFQLYIHPDREFTRDLVARTEAAGYEALVVTADVPVNGPRYRELRGGFALPAGVERVNLEPLGRSAVSDAHRPKGRDIYSAVRAPDVSWKDLELLKTGTRLPVAVKGILHPDDARLAVEHGADAIYVSNHGGRSLDTVPSALEALPRIADRVAGARPLLYDGGIRRGTDIVKALALGATAVAVGRPWIYGLAVAGPAGVARVVEILRTELEMAMGLLGRPGIAVIDRTILWETSGLWQTSRLWQDS
jgi:4-hydroxymandelate oxidase